MPLPCPCITSFGRMCKQGHWGLTKAVQECMEKVTEGVDSLIPSCLGAVEGRVSNQVEKCMTQVEERVSASEDDKFSDMWTEVDKNPGLITTTLKRVIAEQTTWTVATDWKKFILHRLPDTNQDRAEKRKKRLSQQTFRASNIPRGGRRT